MAWVLRAPVQRYVTSFNFGSQRKRPMVNRLHPIEQETVSAFKDACGRDKLWEKVVLWLE